MPASCKCARQDTTCNGAAAYIERDADLIKLLCRSLLSGLLATQTAFCRQEEDFKRA